MRPGRAKRSLGLLQSGAGGIPGGGGAGGEGFDFARVADDVAHLGQGAQFAAGADLDEEVAQGGGFDGAGDDGPLAGIGGELVEDGALGAAADDVDDLDAVGR